MNFFTPFKSHWETFMSLVLRTGEAHRGPPCHIIKMKHHRLIGITIAALLGLTLFTGCQTTSTKAPVDTSRVSVQFTQPEKFTDFRDGLTGTDKGREHYEELITDFLKDIGPRLIPDGTKLEITFTDIDLAGDFLPTARLGQDIRVMKTIYYPRMKLSFSLKDAAGAVVKQGEVQLVNMEFMSDVGVNRNDELFYDINLLRNWIQGEFKK